jgi:hypothetical protein
VLARETYNTANLKGDELWFYNEGAYESVNVTVSDYSGGEPAFESRGIADSLNLKKTVVGSTGGDSDLTCDLSERLGTMTGGYEYLDCTAQPGSTTVNTTGTDASQTKLDIYQSAQNNQAQAENYQTTLNNYLSDAKTQALIIGKNAYIRSLNNGSSEAAARSKAKSAVSDYYATKQVNLYNEWTLQASHAQYLQSITQSETGISGDYITVPTEDEDGSTSGASTSLDSFGTTTLTTVNSTSVTVDTIVVRTDSGSDTGTHTIDPTTGTKYEASPYQNPLEEDQADLKSVNIKDPDGNQGQFEMITFQSYADANQQIVSQHESALSEIDTLVNNTYGAYQNGEINNSDLVDPYVLANQQSAGSDFQGWTAAQLTLLGTNSPENFDQIGSFNVTTGSGTQYEGVLFSQENPTSGQFANGTTYDTANIGGTQYVVTSDQIVELSGTFTIDRITTTSGETTENVTIQKTTYETTNVTELKQQYEDLAYKRAQIEAREKALKQSAGGGLLGGGSVPPVVALAVIGTLLGIVVLQN